MRPAPSRRTKLRRGAGVLLVALALAGVALVWWARRSLPDYAGERRVHGLGARVEVVRDAHAIPHIFAASAHDAYFALGYAHAQDRLWQLEQTRRAASGTLSAVIGARALEIDRLFRTLGLAHITASTLANLDAETHGALDAYAAGINAWLAEGHTLPLEFQALGFEPAPWQASDSVLAIKLLAWQLSGNWSDELWRVRLFAQLSPAQLAEFAPAYGADPSIDFAALQRVYTALELWPPAHELGVLAPLAYSLARFAPAGRGVAIGSNNWAVAGTRSASQLPLLANDPHLALSAPSPWYLAQLDAPDLHVVGATLPALPGVILGHNGHVAWAFTNTGPDTEDLFIERLAPGSPDQYLTPDGPRAFERTREVIEVRGAASVELWVRHTRHGPVISDVTDEATRATPAGHVLALSWVGLRGDDGTLAFPVRAARAADAAALRDAARSFHAPMQNIVYADTQGTLGFVAAGRVPLRAADNELAGLVPSPGWLARYDWLGLVPFENLPQTTSPPNGRIVTANQNVVPQGSRTWLGADWGAPYRHDRVVELLDAQPRHTVESFAAIQRDQKSHVAELLLPLLLEQLGQPGDPDEADAAQRLARWDRVMRKDGREPLLFAAWLRELARLVYADELGPLFADAWAANAEFMRAVLSDRAGMTRWCAQPTAAAGPGSTCAPLVRRALHDALTALRERYGSASESWSWGAAHQGVAAHPLFGTVPLLSHWFNLSTPRGGDSSTVDVGTYTVNDEDNPFTNDWGPGLRAIYDLADLDRSLAIVNSGQSGNVVSPHYRDLSVAWARGDYVPLSMNRRALDGHTLGTLVLQP